LWWKNCDTLSRFHPIPGRYWRTDRQTDGRTELLYQYRASVCWRAIERYTHIKNTKHYPHKPYIVRSSFYGQHLPRRVCLYLEQLKRYKASKLTNAWKMQHISPYWVVRHGGTTAPCYTFWQRSHRADVKLWPTYHAATYRFSRYSRLNGQNLDLKFGILSIPWRTTPKGEKKMPGPICAIMQNFTPIGVTVAEIRKLKMRQRKTRHRQKCKGGKRETRKRGTSV